MTAAQGEDFSRVTRRTKTARINGTKRRVSSVSDVSSVSGVPSNQLLILCLSPYQHFAP